MPRNIPHFPNCAAPGSSHSMDAGSIAMLAFVALVGGFVFGGGAATILWAIIGKIGEWGCVIGSAVAGFLIVGLLDFKLWYYNRRLMCIRHDECTCGTIIHEPTDSTDGDRKMNILIAPFAVEETEQLLIETLVARGAAGELANVPDAIDLQNRQIRLGYVRGLSESDQNKLHIDLVENRMFNQPGRGFLRHLYRRDPAVMSADAFSHSPDDSITAANPNPMFRILPGHDPDEKQLVPYMHCEVEGDRLARILDNVLAAVIAFLAAFLALCILCVTTGIPETLCGWAGAFLAALFALLVLLLANAINNPNDGTAGNVDVDVNDPDFDSPPGTAQSGDVVFIFGDWIMDEEHGRYFEIHPVKAYYLLCRDRVTGEEVITEEVPASRCEFDPRTLTAEDFDRICRIVKAVETTDPDDGFTGTIGRALSTMPPIG